MRTHRPCRSGHAMLLAVVLTVAIAPSIAAAAQAATPASMPVATTLADTTALGFPYIDRVTFGRPPCDGCPPRACPDEPLLVTVSGMLPSGCVVFRGLRELPVATPFTVLSADFVVDTCGRVCPTVLEPFVGSVELPAPLPGQSALLLRVAVRSCPDTSTIAASASKMLSYEVVPQCDRPVPVDSLVRTFTALRVVPEHPCPGDSLTLQLVKNGCPPCVHLTSLGFTRVRGVVATLDWRPLCAEFRCQPETLSLALGRFAAGFHELRVSTDVHVLDTGAPDSTISFVRSVAFEVPRTCDSTAGGCVSPFLSAPLSTDRCALTLAPGSSGDLALLYASPAEMGGVQGTLQVPAPFRLANLRIAENLSGVHLSWVSEGRGARYVAFAAPGATLPAGRHPLLNATLRADDVAPPTLGPFARMLGSITLASDPAGRELQLCDASRIDPPLITLCVSRDSSDCDVNGDGRTDVRDLVQLVRCLRPTSGDSTGASPCFDCDHDGVFGIPDIFCCAREVLHGPVVPHDSTRIERVLEVSMDPAAPDGEAMRVRVRVRGAGTLGAALLRVRYPADRWRLAPRSNADPTLPEGWLPLEDAGEPGLLRLGALRLSDVAADELAYDVRMVPVPGAAQGGLLSVENADFTAPDGVMLTPARALPSTELSGAPLSSAVELSAVGPNPFTGSTAFAVSLPREADVDLAVHDLAGRRIATLATGRIGAGRRNYTWNGAGARDGMYFVRLTVDGHVYSTRVVLLRDGR